MHDNIQTLILYYCPLENTNSDMIAESFNVHNKKYHYLFGMFSFGLMLSQQYFYGC